MSFKSDVAERAKTLAAIGQVLGKPPDKDGYISGGGKYLVLHFDLITIDADDDEIDRDDAYAKVADCVAKWKGIRVGGSVSLIPMPATDTTAAKVAGAFWNSLAAATAKSLREGDVFYLHYSHSKADHVGVIAQLLKANAASLPNVS